MQTDATEEEQLSTGITGLDDVLNGGLPRGHVFLVEGEPGAGKTTLGLQFLMRGVRNGDRVLYVTLSESEREIRKVAQSHGWSLENVAIYEFTPNEDSLKPDDQYSAFHPSDVEFEDTMQRILAEVDRLQPARVVIDSLSEIRLLARNSLLYRSNDAGSEWSVLHFPKRQFGEVSSILIDPMNEAHYFVGPERPP